MSKSLRVSPGIDGIPTTTIPDDPTQFVSWFKSVGVKRWLANGDTRNATAGPGVTIGGQISTPATVSASGLVTAVSLTDASTIPIFSTGGAGNGSVGLTETLKPQGVGQIFAGPATGSSGQPTFRALVATDIPPVGFSNLTPDTHPPTLPIGVGIGPNDEFETGSAIDTAGTRYAGATPWAAFNLSTTTNTVNNGSLALLPAFVSAISINGYTQSVPAGAWAYTAKIATYFFSSSSLFGLILATGSGAGGNIYFFNFNQLTIEVQTFSNSSTFIASVASSTLATISLTAAAVGITYPVYMRIAFSGTNYVFSFSSLGIEGTYTSLLSVPSSTFMPTPSLIGLAGSNRSISTQGALVSDWFRRTA